MRVEIETLACLTGRFGEIWRSRESSQEITIIALSDCARFRRG